ncbi:MAG TPA: OmpA family protein [Myxococcaceae bacterium]|nr:OmpA family protein [Myxococcaceae bacterium]
MHRIIVISGAVSAVLLLAGCPPSYPKCNNDDQCKDHNEVCVQGQCVECAGDQNCKAGFICQGNKCVPKPECTSDANCGPGQRCKAGKCSDECANDADCPGGGRCVNNRCLARGACTADEDCASGQECQGGTCVTKTADTCSYEAIHFEFDKASLTPEAERQLSTLADCIKKAKSKLTLEGHADERGTDEYNLQLSNRRAASVKKYLSDLGVTGGNLDTVGYGFHRPAVQGHNEAAWAANRRVEFKRK